jgi:hypothetical protein
MNSLKNMKEVPSTDPPDHETPPEEFDLEVVANKIADIFAKYGATKENIDQTIDELRRLMEMEVVFRPLPQKKV